MLRCGAERTIDWIFGIQTADFFWLVGPRILNTEFLPPDGDGCGERGGQTKHSGRTNVKTVAAIFKLNCPSGLVIASIAS